MRVNDRTMVYIIETISEMTPNQLGQIKIALECSMGHKKEIEFEINGIQYIIRKQNDDLWYRERNGFTHYPLSGQNDLLDFEQDMIKYAKENDL